MQNSLSKVLNTLILFVYASTNLKRILIMAYDLKIEIFAYQWFHGALFDTELLCNYDVTEAYKDECLVYPECLEASDCDNLYYAIMLRRWLFEKSYLEEIKTQSNEFRHSLTDFYFYVLRTCKRIDLFGSLTIFERVFATCAFVCCLCWYCFENGFPEIMKYGYMCWAMYFDQFAAEFYKQGGWNRLKMVAISYKLPIEFVETIKVEERTHLTLRKIREAIKSYQHFKNIGEIDHNECISISWVKFHTQHINGRSDFDELFEELHASKLKNYSEVENILRQLKYLCDPGGSEIVKSLSRMSSTDSLETSMANLNICDKYVNLKSRVETILASESEQNAISLNLASKSSEKLDTVEKNDLNGREPGKVAPKSLQISLQRSSLVKSRSILKDDNTTSGHFQLKSPEQETKTAGIEPLFENMTISKDREKDVKKNTILTSQFSFNEKIDGEISYDPQEEQPEWEIIKEANRTTILGEEMSFTEDNTEKPSKTRNGESSGPNERENKGTKNQCERITSTRKDFEKINSYEIMNEQDNRNGAIKTTIPTEENTEMKNGTDIRDDARNEQNECNSTRKNFEKINSYEIMSEQDKCKSATKTMIPTDENTEMKNGTNIRDDARNEQNECKIMKRSTTQTHISLSKKRSQKGKNKDRNGTKKEQKLKDEKEEKDNTSLNGQMSTGKNAKAENKFESNVRKEQDGSNIKNFLRMLLVLGDEQGISYVKKTSSFRNKKVNN